jgi:hypothetical protein
MGETTATAEAKTQIPTFGRDMLALAPGAYTLDFKSPVWSAPVTLNGQPSTFAEAYRKLRDSKIQKMPQFIAWEYTTDQGVVQLGCDWPLAGTMRQLVELTRQGIDPFQVTWFYYGHDWSRDGDISYDFFAVHNGKIVVESSTFGWQYPRVLKRREADAEPLWHSHPYSDEAWERYWYHKFYTETMTGQLMVLRTDEPILYHYERPQARDTVRDVQLVTVTKIYRLLLIVIFLTVAIAFPSVRRYAALAAILFGVEYLHLCWRTRKVGKP